MKMLSLAGVAAATLALSSCSKEVILEGLREDIRSPGYDLNDPAAVAKATESASAMRAPFENLSRPIRLPAAVAVASWPQRGANARHLLPNARFSASPSVVWSTKAGTGNERKYRITAAPVADQGRVFTMDSHATVMAHAIGGDTLWSADLTSLGEQAGTASGGGLALGDGKLFATTTQGDLAALDPVSGKVLWRQHFNAAVTGAPTVGNGVVYVSTAASEGAAVNSDTGRLVWHLTGVPSPTGIEGVASAALSGNDVVFPLANRSLLAVDNATGEPAWVTRVAGARPGSARRNLSAFTGEPVVAGGTVYAATASGRAVAVSLADGTERWNVAEGAQGSMAVAGGAVFFVTDEAKLVRLSASTGAKVWSVDLPRYTRDNPKRFKSIWPAFGPVLAGGQLWIASGDGFLRAFDPTDGTKRAEIELPAGAASRPIVVSGMMLVMTEKGDLIGLR